MFSITPNIRQADTFRSSGSSALEFGNNIGFSSDGPLTLLAYVHIPIGASGFKYIYGRTPSSSVNGVRFFVDLTSTNHRLTFGAHSGSASFPLQQSPDGYTWPLNSWTYVAASWDGSLDATNGIQRYISNQGILYRDAIGVASNGSIAVSSSDSNKLLLGNRDGKDRFLDGEIGFVAQWNRVLSESELRRAQIAGPLSIPNGLVFLWANGRDYGPYGLKPISTGVGRVAAPSKPLGRKWYGPEAHILYFDVGGGASDTPSAADTGTLTLTGSAADGIRALLSAADAGTLTLTGSAADALLARLGVADSGSLTLTGSAADALRALAGVAGSGSITLTGSDAAGVYTPVGDTPSAADSGSLTLTGFAAVGTYDRLAAADSGSLTLTGSDAAGQIQVPGAYTSDADAGSLTLLGYDANGVFAGAVTLTPADLDAIAAAVWADPAAVAAHAKLDAIIARITC